MDEQRAWLKARRKRRLRILAVMLSVCVLFTTYPDILATLSVFASEEQAQAEGRYISGFTALSNEIREQIVPVGTELTELSLPDTLEAVVTEQPSEDTAGQPEEDGKEDSGGNDGKESDGDTTGTEDKDSSTGETEEGEPSDNEQENTEENKDADAGEETGDEQDTQPEKDGESEETDGKAATGDEDTADTEEEENTEESVPAEEQQESAVSQETHTVTMQEYHAENVISVQTLENTQTEKQEETVTIEGVTWQSEPEYDGNTEGTYTFTAVLPEGYALAEDVSLPEIKVTVESGIDVIIGTLLDRIAALPEAGEYLALEPDMKEDEDAYAEWEEKLYAYAEEALAIWEEYETLTGEQQAQMPEEELAKLEAWMEIAETLTESSQVMVADGASHTHCICGRNMDIGDHTAHNTGIEYKLLTINNDGKILINGEVKEDAEKGYTLTSGYYYLQESQVTEIGTITIDGDVTLCLNGGTLKHMGETGSVIVVSANSTFTLCDCKNDSGCIMGGKGESDGGGGIFMHAGNDSETTFNMFGGVIKENQCAGGGGGIYCDGTKDAIHPKVNIYGGKIIDNLCTTGMGGGINAAYAQVNIFGGSIEGNKARRGGGINLNNSNIEISNASIINNTITDANYGGGVFGTQCKVFSISGTVNISGNTDGDEKTSNVFFRTGLFFDVTDSLEGSSIGVTVQSPPTSTKPAPVKVAGGKEYGISTADWSCFFSDKDGYEILRKETTEETDSGEEQSRNELYLALPGSCDLFTLSTSGATLSPEFEAGETEYTSTVANNINQVDITATLATTASGAEITIKVNNGATKKMENGKPKTVDLPKDKNTIEITVTSGGLSKTYTIEITKDNANYTVTYNKDGGTITEESNFTEYTYGTGLTLPVPIKMGYTFDGWYEQSDFSGSKVTSISTTDTGAKTYYAKWSANTYTVTYNGNGSTGGSMTDSSYTYGTAKALTANGFTRLCTVTFNPNYTGSSSTDKTAAYTFAGWNTVADGSGTSYDDKAFVKNLTETNNGTVTLYAQWTPTSVTYTPTRAGYTFAGWYTDASCSDPRADSDGTYTPTGDITLYAKWTAKTYTVTYNKDSGTIANEDNFKEYTYGTGLTLPQPTKTYYDFDGWYERSDFSGDKVESISATDIGEKTYYAKWKPHSYTISYDLDGGTVTGNPTEYTIESNAITLVNPSKTGYSFAGWSGTDLAGSNNMSVTIAAGSTGDREYTANWTAAGYTVTLKGGGTGTALTSYTYGIGATLPTGWTKTGYTFAGWYNNENCTGDPVTEISATDIGDKTFWAKWTPQTYQVTFHYHGADGGDTTTSKNVTYDSTYGDLPVPSKTGYTFKGWYTEESGQGNKVDADTIVTTASAHTLHAYWKDETPPAKPVLQDGVTLPADWTNTQTTIPLKLYDGVGVVSLLVSVDGSPYTEVSGFSGIGSVNYSYTDVQEGEHKYQFKAVDAAGNFAESDIFPIKLDQTKPVIGTLTYDDAVHENLWHWIIGKKSMAVHVPVTDAGSGVEKISYTMTPRDAAGNLDSSSAETKTATVTNGEAKITFDKDFRGTITINCTDKAGNAADSVTIGADAGGVIVEDTPPTITVLADRNISDTQPTQPSGVAVSEGYYDSAPALIVTVKDDTGNAITAGIAAVTYQVEGAAEKSVTVDTSVLQEEVTFIIPATEIAAGSTQIKVIIKATDNAGNTADRDITINVKGKEKQPTAVIDYRQEELKNLVPGAKYTIDGTETTADQEGHIAIKEDWLGGSISIVKKGNGSETSDSPAQSLSVPERPAAPNTPELSTRDDKSITLKTILNAQYRLADGTDNWQDSTAFTGLAQKTIYRFKAYYPATDTSFASRESGEAPIATMPTAPTEDKLKIGYAAETLTLTDGIEAFADQSCTIPVTAGSVTAYMGQTIYIRYPANDIIPASLTTAVPIPARPAKPAPGTEDASYPTATDGAITGLTPGTTYEYRVKDTDGNFGAWETATPSGTKIENLPAGDYEVRVKAVETGNASFQSEAAAVTIGATPATKYETPKIRIDYPAETLTGFVPGAKYTIGSDTITAGADGTLPIKKEWFGTTLSITRNGNDKDKLDSDPQSLPIPARPAKPTPTGVDVSTAGGTGKLTGLTAGMTYEVSTDGGKTWASHTADGSGQIIGLLPGTYVVRVKAGADHFVSEPSDSVKIGAYQIKVTFMVDGAKYREVSVDYGAALTDIPPVPAKDNAIGAWCMDEQGTTPAVFTNITADMTVYAVYTTAYTVTLQTGTGYTLSAQGDSESPVKEGGSFTFRFALANGYQRNADFAVKVNGVKVELTAQEPYTYTITDIRENKTVTVEGVGKKPGGKPADGGDKEKDPKPEPEDPSPKPDDTDPENPAPKPPVTPPAKPTSPAPGETPPAEKQPEGRKPGTTPKQEESGEQEPESTGKKEAEKDSADAGQTEKEPQAEKKEIKIGNGTVIVTVVCEEEKCTATVADTEKVVKAVLTPDQQELVNGGETIEIRIDVTDISEKVPAQDKEVIESGIEAYREEVPGLVLGMYVDISMFIKIGAGDWNAITATDEPIEVVIDIPEKLLSDGREFYIIRAHNGEYTFMNDMDEAPDTITVSTDLFSSYAIAYVETEGAGADSGAKCGLCHICPTFLRICYFIWLAIIALMMIIVIVLLRKKKEEQEVQDKGR